AVDSTGGIFIAGAFTGTTSIGNTVLTNAGKTNLFLAKLDSQGVPLWAKRAGGIDSDVAQGIAVDREGNVLLTGYFGSPAIAFDGSTLANIMPGYMDMFLVKYDGDGNVLWAKRGGGIASGGDQGTAVGTDPGGNIFVAGIYHGSAEFDGMPISSVGGTADIFLARYDSGGNGLWVRSAGGSNSERANALAVDAGGNAYIAGSFSGTANFQGTNQITSYYDTIDAFVAAYTAGGNFSWVRKAGGASIDSGLGLAADTRGNVLLCGRFNPTWFELGHIRLFNAAAGYSDIFVTKLSTVDANTIPSITDQPRSRTVVAGSDVTLTAGYIAGTAATFQWRVNGTNVFGATNTFLSLNTISPADAGAYSLVISNSGVVVTSALATVSVTIEPDFAWARKIGGAGDAEVLGVTSDQQGNTYVTGYFSGAVDFGARNLASFGGEDLFVAKYNSAGTLLWAQQAGGPGNDRANAIAFDLSNQGGIIIAGHFSGTANFSGTLRTSAGGLDLFIARYDINGNLTWVQRGGGIGDDTASGVSILPGGQVGSLFVSGTFQNSAQIGTGSFSSAGTNDAFLAKYLTTGSAVWTRPVGGTGNDRGLAVTCDRFGNSFLAGSFSGTANFSGTNMTSRGSTDA
ncbi:MAG: immunoglobulin domain-containing protein, partial [Limisphaerales bacterium]